MKGSSEQIDSEKASFSIYFSSMLLHFYLVTNKNWLAQFTTDRTSNLALIR